MKQLIVLEKPILVTTVGDVVTFNSVIHGITPNVSIIDFKSLRKPTNLNYDQLLQKFDTVISISNPKSTISKDALDKFPIIYEKALKGEKILVKVIGEEDLLTLLAIKYSPISSFIIYGQPREALVIIINNKYIKESVNEFLKP